MSIHIQCSTCTLQYDAVDMEDAGWQMMLHLFLAHSDLIGTEFIVGDDMGYQMLPADRGKLTPDQLGRLAEHDAMIASIGGVK